VKYLLIVSLALAGCSSETPPAPRAPQLQFQANDHIVIVGSGAAERMQHHGWFEAYLQVTAADLNLTVRNHGFSGDRIDHRPRNQGFTDADGYLTISQADVIIAMFGYNESFDSDPAQYQKDLTSWITETRTKKYNGKSAPRIVLVSPLCHENLNNQNLPDGRDNNMRLAAYTESTRAAAVANDCGYIDLFNISKRLYAQNEQPLTQDGIHPNINGSHSFGIELVWSLLGNKPDMANSNVTAVRNAVLDKNFHWFNRYRATDGNDIWGSRSTLSFTDGQTNATVLQHELTQLDITTANRDKVIWAAANGNNIVADDSNMTADIEVISNLEKPQLQGGISKLGSRDYISGEDGIDKFTIKGNLTANLFASEEMFPELANPVQLGVDPSGRLWAAAWATYPKWQPSKTMNDRLLILEDKDRDGVAEECKTFAYVHNPTGFEFWNGGVVVASAPDLLFLRDTDGDDVADERTVLMSGIDSGDTHHAANNLTIGPDGFLYYQRGVFLVSNVESPWQTNQEDHASGMYRFNPRTYEFSFHAHNSPNPHGISFDEWGYHYATDATGGTAYQVRPTGDGHFKMRKLLQHTVRPVPSSTILSSAHFPDEMQGNFLIANSIAFLGLKQYSLDRNSQTGDVTGTDVGDLISSADPNFRPTDIEFGDDGAMYVSDWANAIIGHMQHNVRDPARDHKHGRIYRYTYPDRPLSRHVDVVDQPIDKLLNNLLHPVNGVRHRTRAELSTRNTEEVITALRHWLHQFDHTNAADARALLEGLWLFQSHNVKNMALLDSLLNSPEPHARIAAATVKQFWDNNKSAPTEVAAPPVKQVVAPPGVIVISTIVEEMLYDVTEINVKAGEDVEIWFFNKDYMPHNLVIGHPGSAEEIGKAAEAMGADGFAKDFVPVSDKVIAASALVNTGETSTLKFTVPKTPGKYVYVCTFPGHWQRMQGVMIVE
jgi:azurin/lysophospholipase L1-like esterase